MKSRILLIAALIAATALANPVHAQRENSELKGNLNVMNNSGERNIDYTEDGHRYRFKFNGSKVTELSLDGKEISPNDFSKYDPLVKKIMLQIEKDEAQARKDRAQAELDREQALKDRAQAEKDREQAMKDRANALKDRDQAIKDREIARKERERTLKQRTDASERRNQVSKDREQAERDRAQANKDREQAAKDRQRAEEERKMLQSMIEEIVKEKLVENREAVTSIELDDTKLLINGKEQSDTLHKRFKAKFLSDKNRRINFRNSN